MNSETSYSVLMSVYYKENPEYLKTAMDSIWSQTIPPEDFVLVCDGPLTRELDDVIASMEEKHPNLQVLRLKENKGLGIALNEGLKCCKNQLVARMDSDDISKPNRLELQLKVFNSNENISICSGTICEFIDSPQDIVGRRKLPADSDDIRVYSQKRNPFNHPAVMFRKSDVESVGGYSEEYHLFEDYHLWIRMLINGSQGYNIDATLLDMRTSKDFYLRRGGYRYAKEMLAFHRWMKNVKWTSLWIYVSGAIPHALVCILPNCIRKRVYKRLHA